MAEQEQEEDKAELVKIDFKTQVEDDNDCYEIGPIDFNRNLIFKYSSSSNSDDDEVALVAAKGPVALRYFPHPRQLCANFPFNTTSHASYCSECFCYVCEIAAPCLQWTGSSGHCNVTKKALEN